MWTESYLSKKLRSFNIGKKFRYSFSRSFGNSRHEHPDYRVPDNVKLSSTFPHNPESEVLLASCKELAVDAPLPARFVSCNTTPAKLLSFEQHQSPRCKDERSEFKIEFGPESTEVAVDVPDDFVPCIKSPPTSPRCTDVTGMELTHFNFEHPLSFINTDVRRQRANSEDASRSIDSLVNNPPTSPRYNTTYKLNFNFEQSLTIKNSVVGFDALVNEKSKIKNNFGPEIRGAVADVPQGSLTSPRLSSASCLIRNSGRKVKFQPTLDQVQAAVSSLDCETPEETLDARKEMMRELIAEVLERVRMEANFILENKINSVNEIKQNVEIKKILARLNESKILLDYENKSTRYELQEIVSQCVNSLKADENYPEVAERFQLQNNQSQTSNFNCEPSNHLLRLANEWSRAASLNSSEKANRGKKTKRAKSKLKKSVRDLFFRRRVLKDRMVEITINKSYDPLGLTVYNEGRAVKIGRIISGGMAAQSRYFHEGDEILMINDVIVRRKTIREIEKMLETMTGNVTFIISPASPQLIRKQFSCDTFSLKAQFNYDPTEDQQIPCQDLGIGFQKGDILHVIDQSDPKWWQAYRDDEHDQPLAGLIPSKEFQTMRQQFLRSLNQERILRKLPKSKKKGKSSSHPPKEINTYEEVMFYKPKPYFTRPFIIVGPHKLHQKDLLLDLNKSGIFSFGVSHTTRPRLVGEVEGVDHYFVSKSKFKAMISENRFIRYGKFAKYFYGLSFDSIRTIANSGKTVILYYVAPMHIKAIRDNGLMPYVVFFQSPLMERMKRRSLELKYEIKDEAFEKIVKECRDIEDEYGHYIDTTLVYASAEEAIVEVIQLMNFLQSNPQWVPATWVQNKYYDL